MNIPLQIANFDLTLQFITPLEAYIQNLTTPKCDYRLTMQPFRALSRLTSAF